MFTKLKQKIQAECSHKEFCNLEFDEFAAERAKYGNIANLTPIQEEKEFISVGDKTFTLKSENSVQEQGAKFNSLLDQIQEFEESFTKNQVELVKMLNISEQTVCNLKKANEDLFLKNKELEVINEKLSKQNSQLSDMEKINGETSKENEELKKQNSQLKTLQEQPSKNLEEDESEIKELKLEIVRLKEENAILTSTNEKYLAKAKTCFLSCNAHSKDEREFKDFSNSEMLMNTSNPIKRSTDEIMEDLQNEYFRKVKSLEEENKRVRDKLDKMREFNGDIFARFEKVSDLIKQFKDFSSSSQEEEGKKRVSTGFVINNFKPPSTSTPIVKQGKKKSIFTTAANESMILLNIQKKLTNEFLNQESGIKENFNYDSDNLEFSTPEEMSFGESKL